MTTHDTSAPAFVVGAGPSGLAAAWRLREAGHDVVVFEERDRVGGQLLSVEQDGFLLECGTVILPAAYDSVMGLVVRDSGMLGELVEANSMVAFMRNGHLHELRADRMAFDAARTRLLSPAAKLKILKLARDMWRVRHLLSYDDLSTASAYDLESPAAYCKRRGLDGELYDYLIEPTVRGGAGVPGEMISVVEFFFLWQKVLGTKLFAFERGYTSFVERLARDVDVRLGAIVTEVVEDRSGVRITWEDEDGTHTAQGCGCVVSSMGNRVPDIVPQLPADRKAFLSALQYTSTISINLAQARVPRTTTASFIVVPRPVSEGLFAIIQEHHKAPGRAPAGKGLSTLFFMNEWVAAHMDLDDHEILQAALPEAEKVVPGISDHLEFTRVNRWYPVLVYSHPGLYRKLGRFHAARDRYSRIHLAGSYTSSGNVNTATTAGERAARELVGALEATAGASSRAVTSAR